MTHSALEKLQCAERELRYRLRVYRRRVEAGYMSQQHMDREIVLMEEIAADYRREVDAGKLL
jgi:hypothetical protein